MKLSKKQKQALYEIVHEEIMKVRVSLAMMKRKEFTAEFIDGTLYNLGMKAPEAAINMFGDTPPHVSKKYPMKSKYKSKHNDHYPPLF